MNQLPQHDPSSHFYNDQTHVIPHTSHPPIPPSGTGFPPSAGHGGVPPVPPPLTKPYGQHVLCLFLASYGLFWIFFVMGYITQITWTTPLGMCLCCGLLVALLLLDAHGVAGLQGRIPWQRIRGTNTGIILGSLALFLFPIWLGIYLLRTTLAYRKPPLDTAPIRRHPTLALLAALSATTLVFVGLTSPSNAAPTMQAAATPQTPHQAAKKTTRTPASSAPSMTVASTQAHPTPTPHPIQAPTPMLPTPTPVPPTAVPTQPSVPSPTPATQTGLGGNPYGYDLNPSKGQVITNPPADICSYLACIPSFWKGKGYVEQCQDGLFSKSGGRPGSCSQHGGDKQPLYAHS